jgi:hypothetical protein
MEKTEELALFLTALEIAGLHPKKSNYRTTIR